MTRRWWRRGKRKKKELGNMSPQEDDKEEVKEGKWLKFQLHKGY